MILIPIGQYHIPSVFYTPNTRINNLIQAIEAATPPLVPNAELCGMHYTAEVSAANPVITDTYSIIY